MAGKTGAAWPEQQWQPLEHGVMMDRHKKIIGVVGVGSGAGATFAAMGLAVKMAEMTDGVTFAEGRPQDETRTGAYRMLAVDRHFEKKGAVRGREPGTRTNIYHRVNWVVHDPGAADTGDIDIRSLPGRHIIVDSPRNIDEMDMIICVVDPLPSRIMAGLETFRRIKEQSLVPVIWVLNKNNSSASRREVEVFLRTKFTHAIPLISADAFYKAEFRCSQPLFETGMAGAGGSFAVLAEEILGHN